ncbi:MAG: hypothetical protein ACI8W7_000084 [Gammaproteobacteria bacterium]|jgi:hypothetical protein
MLPPTGDDASTWRTITRSILAWDAQLRALVSKVGGSLSMVLINRLPRF